MVLHENMSLIFFYEIQFWNVVYAEYKNSLWSPTYVLATQIGNSLEISNILVSFLIGFGFSAYVVCGWVDKATSIMDRKLEKCPLLSKTEIEHEKDTSQMSTKYTPKKPPELKSKYMQFLNKGRNFLCVRRTVRYIPSDQSSSERHQILFHKYRWNEMMSH